MIIQNFLVVLTCIFIIRHSSDIFIYNSFLPVFESYKVCSQIYKITMCICLNEILTVVIEKIDTNVAHVDLHTGENCIKYGFQIGRVVKTQSFFRFDKIIKIKRLKNDERTVICVLITNFIVQSYNEFFCGLTISILVDDILFILGRYIASSSTDCTRPILMVGRHEGRANQYHKQNRE